MMKLQYLFLVFSLLSFNVTCNDPSGLEESPSTTITEEKQEKVEPIDEVEPVGEVEPINEAEPKDEL